jgi:hypothetical protein
MKRPPPSGSSSIRMIAVLNAAAGEAREYLERMYDAGFPTFFPTSRWAVLYEDERGKMENCWPSGELVWQSYGCTRRSGTRFAQSRNMRGYHQKNSYNAYSLNNITSTKNPDGSVTIQFCGCDGKIPNCLPIMNGWNYTARLYRARPEVLNGKWNFPEPYLRVSGARELRFPMWVLCHEA